MSAAVAESMLLDADKSPELANVFRVVADAESDGVVKFSPGLCRELVRTVVCRVYAPPLMELCHLIRAADTCDGGYCAFFWDSGPARPAAFRSYAARSQTGRGNVNNTKSGFELTYPDGKFAVTFGRMPFLSILMEFLVSSIGFQALDDAASALCKADATAKSVSDTAKYLASQIYAYLKPNLTSAQNQRKFRQLITFLGREGEIAPEAVNDDLVLAFWVANAAVEDGGDFKTFRSVFAAFLRFMEALTAARDHAALENTRSLGPDRISGEVDPGDIEIDFEPIEATENPLERLATAPADEVRFLTKAEARSLELLVDSGALAVRLPLSVLRSEVFGAAQARITQGLRRHLAADSMAALIDDSVSLTYGETRERFEMLTGHLQRVILASFHALAELGRPEAMTIPLELKPELDYRPLATHLTAETQLGDNVVSLGDHGLTARFLMVIATTEALTGPFRDFVEEAKAAFDGLSRRGFRSADLAETEIAEGYAAACTPLFAIRKCLNRFGRRLDGTGMSAAEWETRFDKDRALFLRQFHLIYGADA